MCNISYTSSPLEALFQVWSDEQRVQLLIRGVTERSLSSGKSLFRQFKSCRAHTVLKQPYYHEFIDPDFSGEILIYSH